MEIHDQIELTIDRLSSGGRGVGRHEGMVVFVPDTAPQEKALVEITAVKKSFAEARLVRVTEPSPFRVTPPCPVADRCGGCTWQHVEYQEQLRQKRHIVADAIRKFAGRGPVPVEETVASEMPYAYRSRIQVHYENGRLGFFQRGSNEIVPIEECLIADDRLSASLRELREKLKRERSGPVRLELSLTESGSVTVGNDPRYADELGFAQVNQAVNGILIAAVVKTLGELRLPSMRRIFDLYAGAGNFTLPIAKELQPELGIDAVELHPASVRQGRERATKAGLSNVRFHESSVDEFLTSVRAHRSKTLKAEDFWTSAVILDPPRAGCSPEVMRALSFLKPELIVYVSCDPVTLARDIGRLPKEAYELLRVLPFDMFPQTDHVETVAVLRRL